MFREDRDDEGEDLGARMRHALEGPSSRGRPAMLIGTDVPGYDVAYLAEAAAALQAGTAVLGPAEDGGYVLIGLPRPLDVFTGIAWSTSQVMAQTRDRLQGQGESWRELAPLWDIDTADDLARWRAAEAG